jgi:hypothetical protein
MSISKIEVKIGEFSFSGEGNEEWLSGQLDKILEKAETIIALTPAVNTQPSSSSQHQAADFSGNSSIASKSLANFLKEKNATVVQNSKFLATAAWLETKGRKRLTTSEVSLALKDASQTKLNNPSQNLDQNVKKGYCEKDGNQFFVTQEGKDILGVA